MRRRPTPTSTRRSCVAWRRCATTPSERAALQDPDGTGSALARRARLARPLAATGGTPRPADRSRGSSKGAVTERTVREAAADGRAAACSARAVLTPLARDQARALGVEIEKER